MERDYAGAGVQAHAKSGSRTTQFDNLTSNKKMKLQADKGRE